MNVFINNKYLKSKIGFKISIVSPLQILKWSYRKIDNVYITGKLTEPYTINYKTGSPEPNGLFCEYIFGPIQSWQCFCGFFNKESPVYEPHICNICGYENNNSDLRRYRMGYIFFNTPIAHIWYLKNIIPYFLNTTYTNIEYYIYYFILNKFLYIKNNINSTFVKYLFGSEYIQQKLKNLNLIQEYIKLKNKLHINKKIIKFINFFNLFILNNISPSWLLLDLLPVIPVGIRPLLYANNNIVLSPLNELYRMIILKNNKLYRWIKLRNLIPITFELIERRNLQQLVDILLKKDSVNSLTSTLKGKYNKFRQYILGKRVDFSGRSVIISGPDLNTNNIGLPLHLCIELFKPFIINKLKKNKYIHTILRAAYFIQYNSVFLRKLIYSIINKEVVLINRAPTLHKMNIQSFTPYISEYEAIKLYPITCSGFNADFDGDQMGIFIILSAAAKKEAKYNMLSYKNLFSSSYTKNMFKYSQSIILGLNALLTIKGDYLNILIFYSIEEALKAYNHKLLKLNTLILIKYISFANIENILEKKYICTTLGRLLLQNLC